MIRGSSDYVRESSSHVPYQTGRLSLSGSSDIRRCQHVDTTRSRDHARPADIMGREQAGHTRGVLGSPSVLGQSVTPVSGGVETREDEARVDFGLSWLMMAGS